MPIVAARYSSLILRADGDIIEHIGEALDCGADDIVTTHMSDEALYHAKRAGRNCVAYYSH